MLFRSDAQASTGPAPDIEGAKAGGTMTVYQAADFSHLDPGQIYVSDGKLLSRLIYRGLTQYDEDENGNLTVVGDLATDAGKQSDGGKTWTYTLKDNLKDANGNPINSADFRNTLFLFGFLLVFLFLFFSFFPFFFSRWLLG